MKQQQSEFIRAITKRVRKDLRLHNKLPSKRQITVYDDGTAAFQVSLKILQEITGKIKEITSSKDKNASDIIPSTMDEKITADLDAYLQNKEFAKKENTILDNVTKEEIKEYCRIKKIPYKEDIKTHPLIQALEKKTPQTKYSLKKSFQNIKSRLQPQDEPQRNKKKKQEKSDASPGTTRSRNAHLHDSRTS